MPAIYTNRAIYVIVLFLMALTVSRFGEVNYAIYLAPIIVPMLWLLGEDVRLRLSRPILPFLMLCCLGALTLINYEFNTVKKLYFILVYTSIFILVDFTKTHINPRLLAILFLFLFMLDMAFILAGGSTDIDVNFIASESTFESTLAFPLGLMTLFFFLRRDYLWFFILLIFSVLALKRIVLLAVLTAIIISLLPRRVSSFVTNPLVVSIIALLGVFFSIEFSRGELDQVIQAISGYPPNHFSQGRQELWSSLLQSVSFNHFQFLFFGSGFGESARVMETVYSSSRILVHSDMLILVVDIGYVFTVLFVFLLVNMDSLQGRILAIFLLLILFTDNVLIYQHLMIPYLLLQAQITRVNLLNSIVKRSNLDESTH